MSETGQPGAESAAPEPAAAPVPAPAPDTSSPAADAPITAREAADLISSQPAEDAAPPKEPSGETEGSDDPAKERPIDAPRSWTKADKEAFAALPRDTQERILALDRTRELELRRGQNEAAEQRRQAEALAQQAEQERSRARQQYEQSIPQKALLIDAQYRQEFGTPTWDQIQEWASYDQPKYVRWQAAYARATAAADELRGMQAKQQQAQQADMQRFFQNAEQWKQEETAKFHEKAPEWRDPKTYQSKVAQVLEYMEEVGYPRQQVEAFANEYVPIQIHDHRFQLIVRDALRYREAEKAAKQPTRNRPPPVQRPGPASNRGEANEARFRDLNRQLDRTGEARDAARLIAALNSR